MRFHRPGKFVLLPRSGEAWGRFSCFLCLWENIENVSRGAKEKSETRRKQENRPHASKIDLVSDDIVQYNR